MVIVPTYHEVHFLITLLTLKSFATIPALKSGSKVGTSTWPVTIEAITTVPITKQGLPSRDFYQSLLQPPLYSNATAAVSLDGLCISPGRRESTHLALDRKHSPDSGLLASSLSLGASSNSTATPADAHRRALCLQHHSNDRLTCISSVTVQLGN